MTTEITSISIPTNLHRRLRVTAATRNKNMRDAAIEALETWIGPSAKAASEAADVLTGKRSRRAVATA